MSEPPLLDYASPLPDDPARPGRIAVGTLGAVVYGVLLLPCLFELGAILAHDRDPRAAVCPGVVTGAVAWRFTAAVLHAVRGRARRRRR